MDGVITTAAVLGLLGISPDEYYRSGDPAYQAFTQRWVERAAEIREEQSQQNQS